MTEEKEYIPQDLDAEVEDIPQHKVPPDLIDTIKRQVMNELRDEKTREAEEAKIRRLEQKKEHEKYVEMMKQSPDPWVEIEGWVETSEGARIELEWNNAFVDYLREQGISGADDDQVVQKWVTHLMYDLTQRMSEDEGDYE